MTEVETDQYWHEFTELALKQIQASGAEYGDMRILDSQVQTVQGEDRRISSVKNLFDSGFGIRVLFKGAWGFAASSIFTEEEVRRTTGLAVDIAKSTAALGGDPVHLVPEQVYRDSVVTSFQVDPFKIPLAAKTQLLLDTMEILHSHSGIQRSQVNLWARRDTKLFSSTEGTRLLFNLLAVHGGISASAVFEGQFASRSFNTPYLRTGYELIERSDFLSEARRVAEQAVQKVTAPPVTPGTYDLLLDPEHLSLTIHESCGHPSELDRVMGYEANYAGTSFLTPEKRGRYRYGSPAVNLVADNTEPGTLASTGYDDDGVACQRWAIVREGLFVGYCTNREVASYIGESRSRGSNRADSWASVPMVRIANIGLTPGKSRFDELVADVRRGIVIEGHGSYSIDQQRYNFQFGGDAFWLIENGQRRHMVKDVIYHGVTPEFWSSCEAVANAEHRGRFGFITCGKGQPGQAGWMTHAASPALFRQVGVICAQSPV